MANAALFLQQPPAPWRPQHLQLFPTERGMVQAERSGKGSALRPPLPAQPSPSKPIKGFPKPVLSWQACGDSFKPSSSTETAFPRSPASALPTPPLPPPWCGCNSNLGLTAWAASSLHRALSHSPPPDSPTLPGSPTPPVLACSRCLFREAQSRAFCLFFFLINFPHYLKCIQIKCFLKCLPHSQVHSSL